jgi:hypothetical protein
VLKNNELEVSVVKEIQKTLFSGKYSAKWDPKSFFLPEELKRRFKSDTFYRPPYWVVLDEFLFFFFFLK